MIAAVRDQESLLGLRRFGEGRIVQGLVRAGSDVYLDTNGARSLADLCRQFGLDQHADGVNVEEISPETIRAKIKHGRLKRLLPKDDELIKQAANRVLPLAGY